MKTNKRKFNKEKETMKDKIKNLFDGDDSNSNNVFDRISHQMTSPSVDDKIDETTSDNKGENK